MKGFLNKVVNGKPNGGGAVGGKPSGEEFTILSNSDFFKKPHEIELCRRWQTKLSHSCGREHGSNAIT